jgi:hypothetical protein
MSLLTGTRKARHTANRDRTATENTMSREIQFHTIAQPLTDAQVAGAAAAKALDEGRYALAEAFARVARQAHDVEVRAAAERARGEQEAETMEAAAAGENEMEAWRQRLKAAATSAAAAMVPVVDGPPSDEDLGRVRSALRDPEHAPFFEGSQDATAITPIPPVPPVPPAPPVLSAEDAWQASQGTRPPTARCQHTTISDAGGGAQTAMECHGAIYQGPDNVWRHTHTRLDHPAVPPAYGIHR